MFSKREIQEIHTFIRENPDAKIYLGADSQRMKKKRVKFVTVLVVYQKDKSRIFKDVLYEKVIDAKLSRPFNRMMREVTLVTELFSLFEDVLLERDFEIHLDVNPQETAGSNVAYGAARGMIWGMVGVEPVCKPHAWCASCVADRFSK